MKKKILFSMCLVSLAAVLLTALFTSLVLYNRTYDELKDSIKTEAEYISVSMGDDPIPYLQTAAKVTPSRVTWIAADGAVLFDSQSAPGEMENHSGRKEFQAAVETGRGEDTRLSSTLQEQSYYYALRLSDGSVLRVSEDTESLYRTLLRSLPVVALLMAVVLGVCVLLSFWQTKRIVSPINNMDLEHPEEAVAYSELSPLLTRIERQQKDIKGHVESLRRMQAEFSAITNHMSEGFLILNGQSAVLSHNRSADWILGLDEDAQGKNIICYCRNKDFLAVVGKALKGEQAETVLKRAGRSYLVTANPVLEREEVRGAVVLLVDGTEKLSREKLRREFSANVSHELKTPLTSISGYAEIMAGGIVKAGDVPELAGRIYKEAQRLIAMVEDIIRLSQLDEGNPGPQTEEVELLSLAEEVCARLRERAAEREVELTVSGNKAAVLGVRQVLDEMITNLVDNAVKYNKTGGSVQVIVEKTTEGGAKLIVADTGIGIPEKDRNRVFERFYRVDKSHSKETGGTGLGLSIVRHGAQLHGAELQMESKLGIGTKVRITFPNAHCQGHP